jgi:hypothetical protein
VPLAKRHKRIKDNVAKEAERLKIATENEDDKFIDWNQPIRPLTVS